jgi:hypothetical protein
MAGPIQSVMSLFSSAPKATPAAQPVNPNGPQVAAAQQQQQQKNGTMSPGDEDGTNVASGDPNTQKPLAAAPLDEFKTLWDTEAVPDGADPSKGKPKGYLSMDPSKFKDHAAKLDFARLVDPALMSKAMGGDAQSFATILNQVTQAAFASSLQATHSMVERGLTNADGKIWERFPGELKKHSLMDSDLSEDFPQANHPAVKPMYDNVRQQMASKYPDASTSELKKMTDRYMRSAFAVKADTNSSKVGTSAEDRIRAAASESDSTDWMKEMQIDV